MDPSLYKAAAEGDIDALKKTAEDLCLSVTPNENTVLHIHITAGQSKEKAETDSKSTRFVKEILNMCPSLLLQANAKGETPLHMAARHGHDNTVQLLIECAKAVHKDPKRGAIAAKQMLRMTNNQKDTALHEAVRFNHARVVSLLIDEDPEFPYSANDAAETPLYLAAARDFLFPAFMILQKCKSPSYAGPNAKTALHAAVISDDEVILNSILQWKGGLRNEVDGQGWTPLHYAAQLGHVSMLTLLLDDDTSAAYIADREGKRTPLHIAASLGHSNIVKKLISLCPDCCELVDKRGWNVLHFAVESGDEITVQVVLENSCLSNLINEKDNEGNTPLHRLAASLCYIPALIKHSKVDTMAGDKNGMSPLDITSANPKSSEMKGFIIRDLKEALANVRQQNIMLCKPT